jgi:uncharacterized membrane protein YbaN (DUF454 family)
MPLVLRVALGVLFLILGVIGSILPIMQGWIFLLLAFLMFFPKSAMAKKTLDRVERRMPRLGAWMRRKGALRRRGA